MQYPRYAEHTYYFLISNCINVSDFLTKDNFCLFSDFKNSVDCKLKKLKRAKFIFYSPPNALCSPDESIQIKDFKHYTFTGVIKELRS